MTLSYPLDLLDGFPGWTTRFEPVHQQVVTPLRRAAATVVEIGPAYWEASYRTRLLLPSRLRAWKARLATLEGGARTFKGYDLAGCWPGAYPGGQWPSGGFDGIASYTSMADGGRTLTIGGCPAGLAISVGDYLSFGNGASLHQAVTDAVADAGGAATFEVRPAIVAAPTGSPPPVLLVRPWATMRLVTDSVDATTDDLGRGVISFSARQSP